MDDISFDVPAGWHALSQSDMRFVFSMMALYSARKEAWRAVALRLALRCLGAKPVCPYADGTLFRIRDSETTLAPEAFAPVIDALRWLAKIPDTPVRLDSIGQASALSPDPSPEISFAQWLQIENLYQGYQYTLSPDLLDGIARILYGSDKICPLPGERISVFYWWTAVKSMAARRYPDFLKPAPVGDGSQPPDPDELRRSVDTQIRALTKGDISKEEIILSLPADRALTELDALAREYAELNRKYPNKN